MKKRENTVSGGKTLLITLTFRILSGGLLLSAGDGVGIGQLISMCFPYGLFTLLVIFTAAVALMWLLGRSFNATALGGPSMTALAAPGPIRG